MSSVGAVVACITKALHRGYGSGGGGSSKDSKGKGKKKGRKPKNNHGRKAKQWAGIVPWESFSQPFCVHPATDTMRPLVEASFQIVRHVYAYV